MKIYKIILLLMITFSSLYSQNVWERTNDLDSVSIFSLAITADGSIIAGTDTNSTGSLFRSTDDGASWTNLGYEYLKIAGILVKPSGEILMGTLDHFLGGGVFRSTNNGTDWTPTAFTFATTAITVNSSADIFVGTVSDGVHRSTDDGNTWIRINQGLTTSGMDPEALLVDFNDNVFVGTIDGGVFRSTNNGDSWDQINQGLTSNYVRSLAINSSGDIFAGTDGSGVFRSTDDGDSWIEINNGLTYTQGYYIYSFLINSSGEIFISTADGIFRSTDNGNIWVQINAGLTSLGDFSLTINPNGYIFAGTQNGVFRSITSLPVELTSFTSKLVNDNIQLNWETKTEVNNYGFYIEKSIHEGDWNSIGFVEGNGNSNSPKEYSYTDKDLFAGGSKFQYRLKQVDTDGNFEYSDAVEVEVAPNEYELSQNYPNPFNPTTTIRFSLPKETQLKINVYNIIGQQVATIAEGMYEAGYHKVAFNASNLPSGTYIYRIESADFVQVKKMVLLK